MEDELSQIGVNSTDWKYCDPRLKLIIKSLAMLSLMESGGGLKHLDFGCRTPLSGSVSTGVNVLV